MAGIVIAGGAIAQEQERPTEEFDESVETRDDRESRTGETTDREGQDDARPEVRQPYDTDAKQRPLPLEESFDPRTRRRGEEADQGQEPGQQQPPRGTAPASTAQLHGRTVVTSGGEEVGTIEQVGYSRRHNERVATVNVGGFLGVSDKVIAIPLSELGLDAAADDVTTSMTRAAIEQQQAFDPSELVTAGQER